MHQFKVTKMSCQGCVTRIYQAIQLIDAEATLRADLAAHELFIDSRLSIEQLSQQLITAGYQGEYIGTPPQGAKS